MNLNELTSKYILKAEEVLGRIKMTKNFKIVKSQDVENVIEEARRYLFDSKYYAKREEFETSLASVIYCEGLLETLRILGFVDFTW